MKTIIASACLLIAAVAPTAFGQLALTGPDSTNVPCGTSVTLTADVQETNGLAVIVTWFINDVAVQTNATLAVTNPPTSASFDLTGVFPCGTNIVDAIAENSDGVMVTNTATIVEQDTNPPVIVSAAASPSVLWPPNHKMVKVTVSADVTDNCCTPATWKIIGVTSSETVNAKGSGHTAPDWTILSNHAVNLRAERSGNGPGRVYTIAIQAEDSAGNLSSTNYVTVTVPHDKGKGSGKGGK
jgi:hypothetical protein